MVRQVTYPLQFWKRALLFCQAIWPGFSIGFSIMVFFPKFLKCVRLRRACRRHIMREFGLKSWKNWGGGWKSQNKTGGSNDNISFFVGLILPPNHVIACCSEPASLMWTKIDTIKWGIVYNYQCFKKKNNVLLCGWVGQSEKNMFLVFFSLNSNIPRYVSCLENIHFMLKKQSFHLPCSYDIKFKYKNVFIKYPYDALFNHVRQKGCFYVYSNWWNKITNKNEYLLYNKCPQVHIRLVSNARRIFVIFNYTPINTNGVFNILKVLYWFVFLEI